MTQHSEVYSSQIESKCFQKNPKKHNKTKQKTHSNKTCTWTFTWALFRIAIRCKQPKWPLLDEWINKLWQIHTKEHYSATKRNQVLTHTITWIDLANTLLSETIQTQKVTYFVTAFTSNCHNKKIRQVGGC